MMGGSCPRTNYQQSVLDKISFSILKNGKSVYVYVNSHFGFENSMISLMLLIWALYYPHPPSLSTGQRSKEGDHHPKISILHQSSILPPPLTPASPTALSPHSPIGRSLKYSDGLDMISPGKQHVYRNRPSKFTSAPHRQYHMICISSHTLFVRQ